MGNLSGKKWMVLLIDQSVTMGCIRFRRLIGKGKDKVSYQYLFASVIESG